MRNVKAFRIRLLVLVNFTEAAEPDCCGTSGEEGRKAKDGSPNVEREKLEQIYVKILETLLEEGGFL